MAAMFIVALLLWGLPIAVIGLVPSTGVALAALAVVGVGNALLDVSGFTLLQRGVPSTARSSVFSVLEVVGGVGISIGGIVGAVLVDRLGIESALILTGLTLPVVAVLVYPWARRLDRDTVVPERQADLLRGLPLFRPLPLTALEWLASGMRPVRYEAGAPLITEGELGDTYIVIETGRVEISFGGVVLGEEGPGQGVGEIALLRDVPRTATVTAIEPVEGWVFDRRTFLDAVTGHEHSRSAAHAVADRRLARGGAGPGATAPLPPD
jgi:MFS family permease